MVTGALGRQGILSRRSVGWIQGAVVVAAVFVGYRTALDLDLLGNDPFLILRSCATRSAGGFLALFREPLISGVGFYRPVLTLSLCLDYAAWNLDPFGYQLSSLFCFSACALALFSLASRLFEQTRTWVPFFTALLFVFHPIQQEIVPFPARRSDLLCGVFLLTTLCVQLSVRTPRLGIARALTLFLLGLLCIGSKETGLLLPLLAFAVGALYSPRWGFRARLLGAARDAVPSLLAVAIATLARVSAIGSLGGSARAGFEHSANSLRLAHWLVLPRDDSWGGALAVATAAGLALTAISTRHRAAEATGWEAQPRSHDLKTMLVAVLWLLFALWLHALTGKTVPRYLFFPAIGWTLLLGALLGSLASIAGRARAILPRASAAVSAALLLSLIAWQVSHSLPFDPRVSEKLAARSFRMSQQLEDLRATVSAMPGGTVKWRSRPLQALPLRQKQLDAWLAIAFPGQRIRTVITTARHSAVSAERDERVVVFRVSESPRR